MRDFHALRVWSKAHQLVLAIYKASAGYPKNEVYGLTSQSRRAAASVASNIAEGCGKNTEPDFARFLQIAMGSASEVQYDLLLAHDLGFINSAAFQQLEANVIEVKRMLATLIKKLTADS
jgi:four helix bundle protein